MSADEQSLFSLVTHSNLLILCRRHGITIDQLKKYIKSEHIILLDQTIPINDKGNACDWKAAENSVSKILNKEINNKKAVEKLVCLSINQEK